MSYRTMYVSSIFIYKDEWLSVHYAFSLCNSLRYQAFYATFLCPEEDQEGFTIIVRSLKEISVSSLENRMIFSSICLSFDYISYFDAHLHMQPNSMWHIFSFRGRSRRDCRKSMEEVEEDFLRLWKLYEIFRDIYV